ncbi:hypothetical protein K435DRAFT_894766 [Dendrothele bispora CBS 962.96]|uniref:Uncharacterized protein n=1 Tax=Dendrothele bispora (strain CBS 962.96) TaxID=1314807 RepID=A0A4S8KN63_DENBC|nr:hypothetical protein K435DRAFT_894766 [Dendrothele bispora CBS 962.96]
MLLLYALARPLPSLLASTNKSLSPPEASLEAQNSCSDLHSCRTIEEILYSCLAVVFACTWVAIHPNIPRRFDGIDNPHEIEDSFTISSARVTAQDVITMLLSLLVPELIILWALRQWFAARKIAEKYSGKPHYGWTKNHGHFLIMGGFALFEDGKYLYTLEDADEFRPLRTRWSPGAPIDESNLRRQIESQNSTDFLTKFIAVVQTTWFILQCIARKTEGLVVTDLEIVTLAFALLNIATYVLWWNKPQRVRYPVKIDYCRSAKSKVKIKKDRSIKGGVETMLTSFRDWLSRKSNVAWKSFTDWIEEPWKGLIRHSWPVRITIFLIWDATTSFTRNTIHLYSGKGSYQKGLESTPSSAYFTFLLLFLIFGGVHCAPWNSTFPTPLEQILWRISAVTVTACPFVILFLLVIQLPFARGDIPTYTQMFCSVLSVPIGFFLSLAYIWARITLIVIAFMELRALPPSAYQTVDWARFIPHI